MDPFHEGGNTEGVDLAKTGASIMAAMKKANPKAVWIIQAWQASPREEMIASLNQGDLLVLDLYSGEIRIPCGIGKRALANTTGFIVCC